jgi:hypothetical protein
MICDDFIATDWFTRGMTKYFHEKPTLKAVVHLVQCHWVPAAFSGSEHVKFSSYYAWCSHTSTLQTEVWSFTSKEYIYIPSVMIYTSWVLMIIYCSYKSVITNKSPLLQSESFCGKLFFFVLHETLTIMKNISTPQQILHFMLHTKFYLHSFILKNHVQNKQLIFGGLTQDQMYKLSLV